MKRRLVRLALFHIAALMAALNSGCLAAAVGTGAGVTCYAYYKGKVCHLYNADLADSLAAVRTALSELGLSIQKEQVKADRAVIRTRTGDGDKVRVYLNREPGRIPADGPLTRIGVRVGTFGDHPLSERILYQVSAHLVPASPNVLTPPVASIPAAPPAINESEAAPPPRLLEPPLAK